MAHNGIKTSFTPYGPADPIWPVIISVPHAGRAYPDNFATLCRFPAERVQILEDRYVDRLTETLWEDGFSGLVAETPRAVIDLNRAETDLDPDMLTAPIGPAALLSIKARGGLGLIPRRTANLGELWQRRFSPDDVRQRITQHYRPYHSALADLLAKAQARHDTALLLDLHSMPSLPNSPDRLSPNLVLGDRFGRSAHSLLMDTAAAIAKAHGLRVAFNAPYAGGHILERHGAPHKGIYAVQIEIDRALYLGADGYPISSGCTALQQMLAAMAKELSVTLNQSAHSQAAE